jgi:hypothetical protein
MFACCGFEFRSSSRVSILASDMAYGVVRQGFDPGSFVSSREPFQLRLRPALVYKAASKLVSDCHSAGQHAQVE